MIFIPIKGSISRFYYYYLVSIYIESAVNIMSNFIVASLYCKISGILISWFEQKIKTK